MIFLFSQADVPGVNRQCDKFGLAQTERRPRLRRAIRRHGFWKRTFLKTGEIFLNRDVTMIIYVESFFITINRCESQIFFLVRWLHFEAVVNFHNFTQYIIRC